MTLVARQSGFVRFAVAGTYQVELAESMLHARSVSGELEKHTDVSGKDLALPTCRERPTTIIFQTKVSSVRTEEEGRGRTGKVGADEGD